MLSFYLTMLESEEDEEKFTQLYITYKKILLKVAYSIVKDYHLANDSVHNSFMKVMRVLDRVDEVGSTRTKNYLITIAQNDAKKMYNKRVTRHENSLEILEDDYASRNSSKLELECISNANVEFIKRKIIGLPDIHTDVLLLRLFNDLTFGQIGLTLDITEEAARKRFERAKLALMELLRGDDVYD